MNGPFSRRERAAASVKAKVGGGRAWFGGQRRHVLGGQGVPLLGLVIAQVPGGEHAAEPLPHVPLGQPGPAGQFAAGRRAVFGQVLEQPDPVAQCGQYDRRGRSAVGQDPSGELCRAVLVHRGASLGSVACT